MIGLAARLDGRTVYIRDKTVTHDGLQDIEVRSKSVTPGGSQHRHREGPGRCKRSKLLASARTGTKVL